MALAEYDVDYEIDRDQTVSGRISQDHPGSPRRTRPAQDRDLVPPDQVEVYLCAEARLVRCANHAGFVDLDILEHAVFQVPYRGGAPAILDIVAGRVDVMFGNMPEYLGQIRGGGLRAIAYGAAEASPLMPELPVISRQGLDQFVIHNWFGIVGPGQMSAALTARWNEEINKAMQAPDVQRRFVENGLQRLGGSQQDFLRQIAADRAKWGEVIRTYNIRPE